MQETPTYFSSDSTTANIAENEYGDRGGKGADANDLNVASLWHDLKTILAATQAGLFILKHNPNDVDVLESVSEGVAQALSLAKFAQENFAESFVPNLASDKSTDLGFILSQVIKVFKPLAHTYGVTLEYDFKGDTVLVSTPSGVVTQVFASLLSNAIKFSVSKKVQISLLHDQRLYSAENTMEDHSSEATPNNNCESFNVTPSGGFSVSSDFSDFSKIIQLFAIDRKDNGDNSFNLGFPSLTHLLSIYGAELVISSERPVCFSVILP